MTSTALALTPTYSPGLQLYKYLLEHPIGRGHFGEVWLVRDMAVERYYALKILNPGTPVDERLREARVGSRLEHNNLVRVHHADVLEHGDDHVVAIAMDYMSKGSITKRLNSKTFLPLPDVVRAGKDILQGLDYLHANNFYHNDIKPNNILLGDQGQAMLTDYGIVGVSNDGSPVDAPMAYNFHKAPEVIEEGQINVQTDLFQAGLTLFRLACGVSCLEAMVGELGWEEYFRRIQRGDLISARSFPPYVPNRLRRVILKAVHADPSQRYQTALAMRRELERMAFAGFWTTDDCGELIGVQGHWQYRFVATPTMRGRQDVVSFRKNARSGKEQRFGPFCASALTNADAKRLIERLMKTVVSGS